MSDSMPPPPPMQPSAQPGGEPPARCQWCSAELEDPAVVSCPSCGAHLKGDEVSMVPGVTGIDAEAILRARSAVGRSRGRSRLLAWISGETDEPPPVAASAGSLAPPPPEVRQEMLRLQLAAIEAELRSAAEAVRMEAEAERSGHDDMAMAAASPSDAPEAPAALEALEASEPADPADDDQPERG